MYQDLYDKVRDFDADHNHRWMDLNPELCLAAGEDSIYVENHLKVLVGMMHTYTYRITEFFAALTPILMLAQLKKFPLAERLKASQYKYSYLNSKLHQLEGLPIPKFVMDMIYDSSSYKVFESREMGLSVMMPLWLGMGDAYVEEPYSRMYVDDPLALQSEWKKSDGSTGFNVNTGRPLTLPEMVEGSLTSGTLSDYGGSWNEFETDLELRAGYLIEELGKRLDAIVAVLKDQSATGWGWLTNVSDPLRRFFTEIGFLDWSFSFKEYSKHVNQVPIFDAKDFAAKYMTYMENVHTIIAPQTSYKDIGGDERDIDERPDRNRSALISKAVNKGSLTQVRWVNLDEFRTVGAAASLNYDIPTIQYINNQLASIKAGTHPTEIPFVSLVVSDDSIVYQDWIPEYPADLDIDALTAVSGITGMDPSFGAKTEVLPDNSALLSQQQLAGGYYQAIEFFRNLSNKGRIFVKDEQELLNQWSNDNNIFMLGNEFYNGVIRIHQKVTDIIDNYDPYQCGFFMVLDKDFISDGWSAWYSENVKIPSGYTGLTGTTNIWNEEYAVLKDGLMWIGDGMNDSPTFHFLRKDLGRYSMWPWTPSATDVPAIIDSSVGMIPARPYSKFSKPSLNDYRLGYGPFVGLRFGASDGSAEIYNSTAIWDGTVEVSTGLLSWVMSIFGLSSVDTLQELFDGLFPELGRNEVNGQETPLPLEWTTAMSWVPSAFPDYDRIYPSTFQDLINGLLLTKMKPSYSKGKSVEDLKSVMAIGPMAANGSEITQSVADILDIAVPKYNKFDKSKGNNKSSNGSRKFSSGSRKRSRSKYKSKNKYTPSSDEFTTKKDTMVPDDVEQLFADDIKSSSDKINKKG
jgi:hypothetical protein